MVVVLVLSGPLLWNALFPEADWPPFFSVPYAFLEPFRSLNGYGLFRVMTKTRPEIIVEGSQDGVTWRPTNSNTKWATRSVRRPSLRPINRGWIGKCGLPPWMTSEESHGS